MVTVSVTFSKARKKAAAHRWCTTPLSSLETVWMYCPRTPATRPASLHHPVMHSDLVKNQMRAGQRQPRSDLDQRCSLWWELWLFVAVPGAEGLPAARLLALSPEFETAHVSPAAFVLSNRCTSIPTIYLTREFQTIYPTEAKMNTCVWLSKIQVQLFTIAFLISSRERTWFASWSSSCCAAHARSARLIVFAAPMTWKRAVNLAVESSSTNNPGPACAYKISLRAFHASGFTQA